MTTKGARRPAKKPRPAKASAARSLRSVEELARLDPFAFRRAMLEQTLSDLEAARSKGTMTAVMELTRQAMRLQAEIAAAEEEARQSQVRQKSFDEVLSDLLRAIAELPDGVFERVEAAVAQRRTGRPRMRIVG